VDAARAHIARVAKVRGLDRHQVEVLVSQYTEGRFLGILGELGVNVLKLNSAIDTLNSAS